MYCKNCGYDIANLTSERCPECGTSFDHTDSRTFAARMPRNQALTLVRRIVAWLLVMMSIGGLLLVITLLLVGLATGAIVDQKFAALIACTLIGSIAVGAVGIYLVARE